MNRKGSKGKTINFKTLMEKSQKDKTNIMNAGVMRKTYSKTAGPKFEVRNAVKLPSNLAVNADSNEWVSP